MAVNGVWYLKGVAEPDVQKSLLLEGDSDHLPLTLEWGWISQVLRHCPRAIGGVWMAWSRLEIAFLSMWRLAVSHFKWLLRMFPLQWHSGLCLTPMQGHPKREDKGRKVLSHLLRLPEEQQGLTPLWPEAGFPAPQLWPCIDKAAKHKTDL